ncbi:MAG: M42 family metallopeptidase [Tissierellia bacterium]|nr:M42 family metallopeptidase [Tissierellia bacterium]
MENSIKYIKELTSIPSPTGYTKEVMRYVEKELRDMGYEPFMTNKGGVMVTLKGSNDDRHRMLTAHLDTLGAMVREIKSDGRLKLEKVGGYHFNSVEGENCLVHVAKTGKTVDGTILLHQTSVHVYKDARTADRDEANMEVRLDEKVTSQEETEKLGIQVGDFISFNPRTIITDNGYVKSRHLDDKMSGAILLSILKNLKEENYTLPYTTHFYFSNNEEIGYGANSNIPSEVVDYLAVDMGALGDGQQSDEYTVSICAKDSSGPYNYDLRQQLVKLAADNNIAYKLDIYPYYGSDASAAMRAGYDVRHALVGAGIESSHAYERTHMDSIKATFDLIELFIKSEMI